MLENTNAAVTILVTGTTAFDTVERNKFSRL